MSRRHRPTLRGTVPDRRPRATAPVTFDRHLVLEQLGGWRGMVDATLPTIAFIVANSVGRPARSASGPRSAPPC